MLPLYHHIHRDPPAQSAMVYGFETTFSLGEGWETSPHQWLLSCDLDTTRAYSWSPVLDLNLLDGEGPDEAKSHSPFALLGGRHKNSLLTVPRPSSASLTSDLHSNHPSTGRGIFVPQINTSAPSGNPSPRETFVVLKPLYNFSPAVFGPLIFRHVEYYRSLGVSKHIIYLRRESIPALLLGNPKVGFWFRVDEP